MTTYTSATLAAALLGDEAIEANKKNATRTVRKFLRDELGEGKAVVGKGGRYALDYNKKELTSLTKRFKAWEAKQEADKAARADALAAPKTAASAPAEAVEEEADEADEAPYEGPSDDDIAALLEDDDEEIEEL
jgi:hypothetical protein